MSLGSNTFQAFRRAWPFGLAGITVGAFGGAAAHWLDDSNSGKTIAAFAGMGAIVGGMLGQSVGMIYVNSNEGLGGIYTWPIGASLGAVSGMAYSKLKKNHTTPKTVMKYGVVGLGIGAIPTVAFDVLRK
jgi:hypothetical protein